MKYALFLASFVVASVGVAFAEESCEQTIAKFVGAQFANSAGIASSQVKVTVPSGNWTEAMRDNVGNYVVTAQSTISDLVQKYGVTVQQLGSSNQCTVAAIQLIPRSSAAGSEKSCEQTVAKTVREYFAGQVGVHVNQTQIADLKNLYWTEMTVNNTGKFEVTVQATTLDHFVIYDVTARQMGRTSQCTVTQIKEITGD
jgi:hypothetical protein